MFSQYLYLSLFLSKFLWSQKLSRDIVELVVLQLEMK
jgi:hypothetical protein